MTHLSPLFDLLKTLVREPSVVGAEAPFFRVLRRELEETGVRVTQYQGVLVAEGSAPESHVLSAHVDRHGLICTGPNEFQYAAFVAQNRGDNTGDSISEQTASTLIGRFHGERVHAYDPWSGAYLGQGTIDRAFLSEAIQNIVFEVDGLSYLRPGTPVGYLDRLSVTADHIAGQLDNVLSAAVQVHAFRLGYRGTALFTAQEEAGRSWRHILAWLRRRNIEPDRLIVLDTSPFPDRASAEAQDVVLRHRDANGDFNPVLVEEVASACGELGLIAKFKDRFVEEQNAERARKGLKPGSLGRTEMGHLVSATGGRVNGATLQFPTTGYHTPTETASIRSVDGILRLLGRLLEFDTA